MVIVTSLSPNHANFSNQEKAVESWKKLNAKAVSINHHDEVIFSDLAISRTHRTIEALVGKKLVSINAMVDYAIELNESLLLINSDIIIDSLPEFKKDGVTILSRYDYTNTFEDGKMFPHGFDLFFIPKEFLTIFPPSIYALGAAWFDFWIPYHAIKSGVPVYWPQGKYIYHKLHQTQYSMEEWNYIGEFFKVEFKFNKLLNIGQVATQAMINIKSKVIS